MQVSRFQYRAVEKHQYYAPTRLAGLRACLLLPTSRQATFSCIGHNQLNTLTLAVQTDMKRSLESQNQSGHAKKLRCLSTMLIFNILTYLAYALTVGWQVQSGHSTRQALLRGLLSRSCHRQLLQLGSQQLCRSSFLCPWPCHNSSCRGLRNAM